MSTLHKDHILSTGGATLGGGVVGAVIGAVVGGTPGLTLGAVAGGALGAIAGEHLSEAADTRGDLGHFQQVFHTMEYYVDGMTWDDYKPAYRYGLDTYATRGGQPFAQASAQLAQDWPRVRGESRLEWPQAQAAVAHAWRELDDNLQARGRDS
ncbi:hypothetical protein IP90_03034 [Luteimonas cucumeris]|uniref:Outer membrane protein with glycine zipper n=1 Tax=Luteimonas cucumeris TaxID=985012 RepID=A0A562KWK4_9GAMM|nr:hypothetical protein [Luteimonas cucumeris]TWH99726.1 hypothetical protein IP90_03034 [Luteimonas cucumeris]